MTYITETIDHGRPSRTVNLAGFAADLAAALQKIRTDEVRWIGGVGDYPEEHQAITVGINRLDLRTNRHPGDRVRAYLEAPDVKWGDWNTSDKYQKIESATVNPDGRSIDTIAKDLNRRVISANLKALELRREYAAEQAAARSNIVKHIEELKAAFPGLDFRHREGEQSATFYGGGQFNGYLSGSLNSNGEVTLDRLSLNNSQFRAVAALLAKKGK